jgi:hypothetical protein
MCPACATVVLTIAGISYAVNKLRKQNDSAADEAPASGKHQLAGPAKP